MPSLTGFHKHYIQIDLKAFHMNIWKQILFHILHKDTIPHTAHRNFAIFGFNCYCLVPDPVAAFSSQVLKCKSLAA